MANSVDRIMFFRFPKDMPSNHIFQRVVYVALTNDDGMVHLRVGEAAVMSVSLEEITRWVAQQNQGA